MEITVLHDLKRIADTMRELTKACDQLYMDLAETNGTTTIDDKRILENLHKGGLDYGLESNQLGTNRRTTIGNNSSGQCGGGVDADKKG